MPCIRHWDEAARRPGCGGYSSGSASSAGPALAKRWTQWSTSFLRHSKQLEAALEKAGSSLSGVQRFSAQRFAGQSVLTMPIQTRGPPQPARRAVSSPQHVQGMRHRSQRSLECTYPSLPPIDRRLFGKTSARDRRAARSTERKRMSLRHAGPFEQGPRQAESVRTQDIAARVGHLGFVGDRHGSASLTDEWSTETEHNIAPGNQAETCASSAVKVGCAGKALFRMA